MSGPPSRSRPRASCAGAPRRAGRPGGQGPVARTGIDVDDIEDLILGCAFPEGEQGLNVAGWSCFSPGLPDLGRRRDRQPVLRFLDVRGPHGGRRHPDERRRGFHLCRRRIDDPGADDGLQPDAASGPQRTLSAGLHLHGRDGRKSGHALPDHAARAGGLRADRRRPRAASAQKPGRSTEEIVPITANGATVRRGWLHPRPDTTAAVLAGLQPAFDEHGTVTAGTSSPAHRRGRGRSGVQRGLCQGARPEAARPDQEHRGRRLRAGDHGHRPGAGDAQGAAARRARHRRHRRRRGQ